MQYPFYFITVLFYILCFNFFCVKLKINAFKDEKEIANRSVDLLANLVMLATLLQTDNKFIREGTSAKIYQKPITERSRLRATHGGGNLYAVDNNA